MFAVQTTFSEDGVDVVTLDPDRVERLKAVFWDMTAITTETEEGEDSGEVTLRIIVEARTAGEMREVYGFTDDQNAALDELLAEEALLEGLISDLSVSQADAAALAGGAAGGSGPRAPGGSGDRLLPGGQGKLLLGREVSGPGLG